ncbi:ATP-binding cassette domain-containing protein [uncultured Piscinibacter sp.]|uniref:ATP-binding cassette domain-containing protein n=1 Tax=uncultured Piscinibacter sp. TaxID=1131835 RepID=UPI0026303708|nr:ATP-binding cassette domain-containing protein [uncultured Piscinibacter sp.]
MIELRALRYAWPRTGHDCLAIDALSVGAGELLFLHGPSGCGKSTLLSLLAGVLLPREGTVSLAGCSWASLPAAARDAHRADHVGYLFQQFNLLPWLSVGENVLLGCRFSRLRAARAAQRSGSPAGQARSLLQHVGLAPALWPRAARELSVGQQQRVAAARALIGRPEVVIADEPTSALDGPLRDGFMDLLIGECRDSGSTLVFVSHDERLARRFDRAVSLPELNRAAQGTAT